MEFHWGPSAKAHVRSTVRPSCSDSLQMQDHTHALSRFIRGTALLLTEKMSWFFFLFS